MGLVSTLGNPVPEGAITGTLKAQDGVLLRHARWAAERRSNAAVSLLQGRVGLLEKYVEVVRAWKHRGFAVVTFDWRWQGLSGRVLADRQKGYVENFRQYDTDLETVITEVLLPCCARPFIGLAHSMG